MRLGVLTGGGDVPGLNSCIKAVVHAAAERGWEVYGFRRGWAGPLNFDPADTAGQNRWVERLDVGSVRRIDRSGGTVLHTSRTNPGRVAAQGLPDFLKGRYSPDGDVPIDCTGHVLDVLDHLQIDSLIPIGGDDTLSYAAHLAQQGFQVVAVPKTMDNDVHGTDYCIGFSTAVSRSVDFIHALRTTTGSHERIAVIELFGRHSGETALISGFLAGADRVLISEVAFDADRLAGFLTADRAANPSNYAMVVVSEGATMIGGAVQESGQADAYGHRKLGGIGDLTAAALKASTGINIVSQKLGYLMRAGAPDSLDRMVATCYGTLAVQILEQGRHGVMVAIRDGNYTSVPIDSCITGEKRVDVAALYDPEAYRPRVPSVHDKPMFLY